MAEQSERKPTNEDGVQDSWPVRGRLYVSVLVHSLYGWSHIEGIHLILETEAVKAVELNSVAYTYGQDHLLQIRQNSSYERHQIRIQ